MLRRVGRGKPRRRGTVRVDERGGCLLDCRVGRRRVFFFDLATESWTMALTKK